MGGRKHKVLVAMSGGVDSSVSAALLKKEGYEATGVFLRLHPYFKKNEKKALRAAEEIGISLRILDCQKEFEKKIIGRFLAAYKKGQTPNPCVVCNQEIKFNFLLKEKKKMGADFIATGHHVRVCKGSGGYRLLKAKDESKDQSYFLWRLGQNVLSSAIFPAGNYKKIKIRELAKKMNLSAATEPDSQEICFAGSTAEEFIKENLGFKKGKIKDKKGQELGWHKGLWFYTKGQRKRIGLSGGPYYVLGKDFKKNILVVTKDPKDLFSREVIFKHENWISGKNPDFPVRIKAKIRLGHKPSSALLDCSKIVFEKPQAAVVPGQSVVFYSSEELLGGGIIV